MKRIIKLIIIDKNIREGILVTVKGMDIIMILVIDCNIVVENVIGHVQIADEVIAVIAGLAAGEVEGVANLSGTLSNELAVKLGKKTPARGVRTHLLPDEVEIEISMVVYYEYSIPEVASLVQDKVKQAVETMTGLHVSKVNIKVAGVKAADAN